MQRRTGGSQLKKVRYSFSSLSLKTYLLREQIESCSDYHEDPSVKTVRIIGILDLLTRGFSQQRDSHTLYLEQELDSLKVVLDIKTQQLHQQEKKLMELEKLVR